MRCDAYENVLFLLRGGIIDCWGSNMLAKIVDALKALAVVNHEFTCQPGIIEGQGRIFASAVIVDVLPDEIAVARRSTQPQLSSHLIQEFLMCCRKVGPSSFLLASSHRQTPEREFRSSLRGRFCGRRSSCP